LLRFRNTQEVAVNKSELIDAVSKSTSLAKRDVEDTVNALVHTVMGEVRSGRRVAVVGFGSFNPTRRAARTGRNPQTGAPVKIAASKGVRFGPSSTFKDVVNGKAALAAPKVTPRPAKATATKSATKRTTSAKKAGGRKKAAGRKVAARKTTARKTTAKKATGRKKAAGRKTTARKTTARKTTARKSTARKATRARKR
jgi:DNA-binding protein HU-beta